MGNTTCNCNPKPAPKFPEQVTGMYILAESLRRLGLMDVFGLVGIPVTEAAYAMQKVGMNFYGFRFEQQAGMAAATYGYLTRRPGVLLTVSSLGFMNGLTATANATVNCYPMIQISGATDPTMVDMKMGTYEELDQLNTARPLVKAAFRCSYAKDIPSAVARAYRAAVSGRPAGVYIDEPPRPRSRPSLLAREPLTPDSRIWLRNWSRRTRYLITRCRWPRDCCPTTARSAPSAAAPP